MLAAAEGKGRGRQIGHVIYVFTENVNARRRAQNVDRSVAVEFDKLSANRSQPSQLPIEYLNICAVHPVKQEDEATRY